MSAICARLSKGKGRFTRGWKPQVSTLLCARAASAHSLPRGAARSRRPQTANPPLDFKQKTPRPLGANPLTQFVYPAQPVLKRLPPGQGEPPARFRFPAQPVQKKAAAKQKKRADVSPSALWKFYFSGTSSSLRVQPQTSCGALRSGFHNAHACGARKAYPPWHTNA